MYQEARDENQRCKFPAGRVWQTRSLAEREERMGARAQNKRNGETGSGRSGAKKPRCHRCLVASTAHSTREPLSLGFFLYVPVPNHEQPYANDTVAREQSQHFPLRPAWLRSVPPRSVCPSLALFLIVTLPAASNLQKFDSCSCRRVQSPMMPPSVCFTNHCTLQIAFSRLPLVPIECAD